MPSVSPQVKFTILCYLKHEGYSSLTFCYFCINLVFELSFSHNYCSVSLIFFTFLKFFHLSMAVTEAYCRYIKENTEKC